MSQTHEPQWAKLLRRVDNVGIEEDRVVVDVTAVRATTLGGMPGWLTGEPFDEQGVEVTMPNLPKEIDVPPLDPEAWRLTVSAHGPRTVRLTAAPLEHRLHEEHPSWLGIVTDDQRLPVSVEESEDRLIILGEEFSLEIARRPFAFTVFNAQGEVVLKSADRLRQVSGFPVAPPLVRQADHTALNLELAAGESVSGFGEMFGRLEKNGQHLRLRSEDALGTGTGLSYKPVPLWHSTAGYAGFLNTGAQVDADVGHTRPSVLGLGVEDEALDLFLMVSDKPSQRLADYTSLTGRSVTPPLWAFGYWMGRCRYHSREQMLTVSEQMEEHDVPCDVLHLDPDWLVVDRLNTDFIWNEDRFGPRLDFVRALASSGRRLSVWELPYIDPISPRYRELESQGLLVRTEDGETAGIGGTPTPDGRPRGLMDFANSEARRWWTEQHRPFLEDGVAVFKTDFGEGFPRDGVMATDIPQTHHHNLYPLWYNAATSDAIRKVTGAPPLVWGRSGWAGSHRYPGQWGGDAESSTAGMQATLRGGLSYAISAPGFWSHDIGGFYGPELTPELYVRWTQFGAFSPLMRAHGLRPREPWEFGHEALRISRRWIRRRYELLPYLWQQAQESVRHGLPLMRPLNLEFPEDPAARGVDDVFMLGESLLVVPVFDETARSVERTFYLPAGQWTDLYTGERFSGGKHQTVTVPLEQMPVLVRHDAAIPRVGVPAGTRSTEDLLDQPWELLLFGDIDPDQARPMADFSGGVVDPSTLTVGEVQTMRGRT